MTLLVTTTGGSGTKAWVLALARHGVGVQRVAVDEGSWSQWCGRTDTPVATGLAKEARHGR